MRVFLVVLDSVGIGGAPDAAAYGDVGADTLGHVLRFIPDGGLPNLRRLGYRAIQGTSFYQPGETAQGCYGSLQPVSAGKDTTTGHWEIAGIHLDKPFPLFHDGFPAEAIAQFEKATGRGVLGNVAASGTAIIQEFGGEQALTGKWIVYTSADSVFQVAAHEDVIPVEELYRGCEAARAILQGPWGVARVIARPFSGRQGAFARTDRRRDFSLSPVRPTMLDKLHDVGIPVVAVGKIQDIFADSGITEAIHTHDNADGIKQTLALASSETLGKGLVFTNLVDFDMKFGHRRDPQGYAEALMQADAGLGQIMEALHDDDMLVVTADHGCDPLMPGTDHTRECVPLLVWGKGIKQGVDLGTLEGFYHISATILDAFGMEPLCGNSFLPKLL